MKSIASFLAVGLTLVAVSAFSDDASFYEKLAEAGMAEVMAGQIAQTKGTSGEVREFGALMVEHHGAANKQLADLAKSKNVKLPDAIGAENREALKALQAKEGPRFDSTYLAEQVKAHEEAVQLLKSEIASGTDPEAKAFAQEMLPTVESHLSKAYHLTGQDAKAKTTPN